jgi:hypothetical protein
MKIPPQVGLTSRGGPDMKSKKKTAARSSGLTTRHEARPAPRKRRAPRASVAELRIREIESLRAEVERRSAELLPRWNANPEDVQRSVAQLVLSLVEFLRKLLERQAIRRMEAETLGEEEIERIGVALMRLEETVHDLARRFGLDPEELNLDLGPLGRLS